MATAKKRAPTGENKSSGAVTSAPAYPTCLPQEDPVHFQDETGQLLASLMVDAVRQFGGKLEVDGWLVGTATLRVLHDGTPVETQFSRRSRPDVAAALGKPEASEGHGFTLICPRGAGEYALAVQFADHPSCDATFRLDVKAPPVIGPAGKPGAMGFVERAAVCPATGDAVVYGWAVAEHGASVWLETEGDQTVPIEQVMRLPRPDILDLHVGRFGANARNAGFIARLPGARVGGAVRLMSRSGFGTFVVSEMVCGPLPVGQPLAVRHRHAREQTRAALRDGGCAHPRCAHRAAAGRLERVAGGRSAVRRTAGATPRQRYRAALRPARFRGAPAARVQRMLSTRMIS
jgi:hypothetical protein